MILQGLLLGGGGGGGFTNPLLVPLTITPATSATPLTINATNGSTARLLELQVNGVSAFKVLRSGAVSFGGSADPTSILDITPLNASGVQMRAWAGASNTTPYFVVNGGKAAALLSGALGCAITFDQSANGFSISRDAAATINAGTSGGGTAALTIDGSTGNTLVVNRLSIGNADTGFQRDAANTLALRNGVAAQTFRVYGTFSDASNGDWLNITKSAAGDSVISSTANGSGTGGGLQFAVPLTAGTGVAASNVMRLGLAGLLMNAGKIQTIAGTTATAPLQITSGVAPTSPVSGDMWFDGTDVKFRVGGTTKTFTLL